MLPRCLQATRAARCLPSLLALWLVTEPQAWAQPSPFPPYQHRALYLFNFAKFTKWPNPAGEEAPFIVGILGRDPFKSDIGIITGKPIKNGQVEVRHYPTLGQLGPCHLLFIAESEQPRLGEVLQALKGKPVLTVAEMEGFIQTGGMINLFLSEKKTLSFDINLSAAEAAGLKLDTRLLRLARDVKTE